ncbi:MAG: hypothetical protein R3286_20520, partial [Gammaproteobacteria bacterium]|nr:hypothetical protein [Gammaproteobacteria bacterium]
MKIAHAAHRGCIVAAALVSLLGAGRALADDEARAKALANRMIDSYASLSSYRDAGTIEVTVLSEGRAPGRSTSRFATHFVRPDRLRFDWERTGDAPGQRRATVWNTPEGAWVRVDDDPPVRKADVEAAMLAAGGESSSVLYLVPRYLFMSEQCCGYRNLPGARFLGAERDGGRELVVLEFDYSAELKRKLWLDEQSLLVHKVETASERGAHRVLTVVTFDEIATGAPIDDALFRVDADAASSKIGFDLARLDAAGLRGQSDGKVAVAYEFCIPASEALRAQVTDTDATARCTLGPRGRIGCAADAMLC